MFPKYSRHSINTRFLRFAGDKCVSVEPFVKLLTESVIDSDTDKTSCVRFHRDIWLLLDSKHAESLGSNYLSSMSDKLSKSPSVDLSSFSDDDLFSAIKSRFVQSSSELSSYVNSLEIAQNALRNHVKSKVSSKVDSIVSSADSNSDFSSVKSD